MNAPSPFPAVEALEGSPQIHSRPGRGSSRPLRRVLVPLDCGGRSQALLARASEIAEQLGAEVTLVHIYQPINYAPAHSTAEQITRSQAAMREFAQIKLRETARTCGADNEKIRNATLLTVSGDVERAICEVATETGADLILVSTHGYCGLKHLFLGSKAEWIVRHAPCAVMVVPVHDDE